MSATYGPCPKCGTPTMYADRTPTPCHLCRGLAAVEKTIESFRVATRTAAQTGNRKQRRAAKGKGRKK